MKNRLVSPTVIENLLIETSWVSRPMPMKQIKISPPSNKLATQNCSVVESCRVKHKRKPTRFLEEEAMANTVAFSPHYSHIESRETSQSKVDDELEFVPSKKKRLSRSRFVPRHYQIQSREVEVRLVETCMSPTGHDVDIVASVPSEGKLLSGSKSDRSKTDNILTVGGFSAAMPVSNGTIEAVDTVNINTDSTRIVDLSLKSCHSTACSNVQERMDEGSTVVTQKVCDMPVEDLTVINCQSMVRDVEEDPTSPQIKSQGLVGLVSLS